MTEQLSLFDQKPESNKQKIVPIQELEPIDLHKDLPGAKLLDLIPADAALEISKHYETRAIHVGRILALLKDRPKDAPILSREEIGQQLSMPKALSEGTVSVMRRLGLVDAKTRLLPLGELVLAHSPYLDNPGLLWLLHYLLASNAQLVLWSNLFNFILFEQEEASIQEVKAFFRPLLGRWSEETINKKIRLEINGIFKTYTGELFYPLSLIRKIDKASYTASSDTGILPPWIWLSILLVYRDRYYPGASALEIPLIVRANYSPGRILRQSEASLRWALDGLHNAGLLGIETRSGLDQVRFKREHTWILAAAHHLQGETPS